jgi:hypothetical protein
MTPIPDQSDPVEGARSKFFGPLVPGMLGCVFDHSAANLVVGHIEVTESLIAGTGFLFAPAVVARAGVSGLSRIEAPFIQVSHAFRG